MAVGLGGPTGGIAGTAAFRLPPATDLDAHELIGASKAVTSHSTAHAACRRSTETRSGNSR